MATSIKDKFLPWANNKGTKSDINPEINKNPTNIDVITASVFLNFNFALIQVLTDLKPKKLQ